MNNLNKIPGFTAVSSLSSSNKASGSFEISSTFDEQQTVVVPQLSISGCFKLGRTSSLGDIWICGVEDANTDTSHWQIYYGG